LNDQALSPDRRTSAYADERGGGIHERGPQREAAVTGDNHFQEVAQARVADETQPKNKDKSGCEATDRRDEQALPFFHAVGDGENVTGFLENREVKQVIANVINPIDQAAGDANATVELTPEMAAPALDMLAAYKKEGKAPPKWQQTPTKLYLQDTAAAEYERRKDLY
jgi:hypothetical protein